jgi:hypothetical protein
MPSYYHSVTTNWSSKPSTKNTYGKRTEVTIKNGTGFKVNAILNKRGKTKKQVKKHLSKSEISSIMNGQFIPGFWKNCTFNGACGRHTMRSRNRV